MRRVRLCLLCAAKEVSKEIEEFDGLEALRLEGNTVGVEAAKVIAKALEKKAELKVRSFSRVLKGKGGYIDEMLKACLFLSTDRSLQEQYKLQISCRTSI